jgi:dipeptidyl aminopeptidase/acylaminoacyl peptidase
VAAQIYTIAPEGGGLRQLTHADTSNARPRWSPDGKRIAFEASHFDGSGYSGRSGIFVMDADGSGGRLVAHPSGSAPINFSHPTWSPDGREIAFSTDDQEGEVYAMPVDGSRAAQRRLTINTIYDGEPSWGLGHAPTPPKPSPPLGSARVAFVARAQSSEQGASRERLGVVNIDGTGYQLLKRSAIEKGQYLSGTAGFRSSRWGGWSGDGRYLAAAREEWAHDVNGAFTVNSRLTDIFRFDTRNPNAPPLRLTRTRHDNSPTFLFGGRILFERNVDPFGEAKESESGLFVMNPDGTEARPLARPSIAHGYSFVPSPDGRKAAFVSRASGYDQIWILDLRSRRAVRWPNGESFHEGSPRWSPTASASLTKRAPTTTRTKEATTSRSAWRTGTARSTVPWSRTSTPTPRPHGAPTAVCWPSPPSAATGRSSTPSARQAPQVLREASHFR